MVICKTWTRVIGTLANSADPNQGQTICLNYREFRVKGNNLKFPFKPMSKPTLRDNLHTSATSALIIKPPSVSLLSVLKKYFCGSSSLSSLTCFLCDVCGGGGGGGGGGCAP